MSQHPFVAVKKVEGPIKNSLTGLYDPNGVDLGGKYSLEALFNEIRIDGLIERCREKGGPVYLLVWEGNKIPRGAKIMGHEIVWTQNGLVSASLGAVERSFDIGTYDRLVEFGGKTGNLQVMMVYVFPSINEKEEDN